MSHTEIVLYSDYHDSASAPVKSKIISGKLVYIPGEGIMNCPRCYEEQDGIPHGYERTCPKCKLQMIRFGNSLSISEDKNAFHGLGE